MNLLRELVEHGLKIFRQRTVEFHPSAISRMRERQPCRVQERPRQMRDGAEVPGHPAPRAAVQRIPHDRMADRAQMNADLMSPARVNGDARQRQYRAELLSVHDSRHRLAAPPGARGHLLAIAWIAADRRVDPP